MTDLSDDGSQVVDQGVDAGAVDAGAEIVDTTEVSTVLDASEAKAEPGNYFSELPGDWRNSLATLAGFEGDDLAKRTGQLERVVDIGTLAKNYFSAQDRIRAGAVSTGLAENPTDEQLAEYREANNIPDAPENYNIQLDDGLVLGEEDERIFTAVSAVAHKHNTSSEAYGDMVNAMLTAREVESDRRMQQDGMENQQATALLKNAWGQDFVTNQNMAKNLVGQLPESVRDNFINSRMADGSAVFNNPEMLVFFADAARKIDPAGTVVPNANNPVQAINDEIASLEDRMGEPEWYKDQAANDRLEQLYDARERMSQG